MATLEEIPMVRPLLHPAAAVFASGLILAPASGFAHAALLQSDPAANSTVAAPKTVKLTFSEKLAPTFSGFELTMRDGMKMAVTTKMSADGRSLIGTPNGRLMSGTYKVSWHAASAEDGHRMESSFTFKVK
jgi:hypothetical protein